MSHKTQPFGAVRLTVSEAKRLRDEAGAQTMKELRILGMRYFQMSWLAAAKKKTIVRTFQERLDRFLKEET